jgi:hypothetical protein
MDVRERLSGGSAEVIHCHMLVHLAHPFLIGGKRLQVIRALERLIDRHGNGNCADYTLKLTFPRNPNGLYLVKGGGPEVCRRFGVVCGDRALYPRVVGCGDMSWHAKQSRAEPITVSSRNSLLA